MTKGKNEIISIGKEPSGGGCFFSSVERVPSIKIHTGCKLCNSSFRQQSEELFLQTQNISHVHRWLDQNNEKLSWSCVRNHLQSHLSMAMSAEKVDRYCKDMVSWCQMERKKEQRLEAMMSILERRIVQLAAIADGREDSESVKMTETITKLVSTIISIQQQVDDYKRASEPVKIVIEKIQQIVQVQLSATPSREVRKVLMNVVDVLEHDLGGLIENGQN